MWICAKVKENALEIQECVHGVQCVHVRGRKQEKEKNAENMSERKNTISRAWERSALIREQNCDSKCHRKNFEWTGGKCVLQPALERFHVELLTVFHGKKLKLCRVMCDAFETFLLLCYLLGRFDMEVI